MYSPCLTPLHYALSYPSQQSLPRQFNLLRRLPLLPPTLARTYGDALTQLDFVFDSFPGAGTVVWEVDAGEGAGAEVFVAVCCTWINDGSPRASLVVFSMIQDNMKERRRLTILILLLIPLAITAHILRLLLLLMPAAAAKHLVEEAELRVGGESEETH